MEINKNESDKQLTYSIENIPAITEEILSPPLNELTPELIFTKYFRIRRRQRKNGELG